MLTHLLTSCELIRDDLLQWVDREKRHFKLQWSHKSAGHWTLADSAVFQDWDKIKGRYNPEEKNYYMYAKQCFGATLKKQSSVRQLPCKDKYVKKYQLMMDGDERKEMMQIRSFIPSSIIRKNPFYIEKMVKAERPLPTSVIHKDHTYHSK
ncbi:hypothetical protein JTE90_024166 [Oedothorax gibbosus]|uniref:IRF tryptophan pentad repeat domain-containing protein n=1 Tax=Oedothorax gibbosus TaxID=931172 RepID=A0AAV6UER3_9ARAC|nr:hypothetical protein JTE90_024166 [Oedothorax gibbosus]